MVPLELHRIPKIEKMADREPILLLANPPVIGFWDGGGNSNKRVNKKKCYANITDVLPTRVQCLKELMEGHWGGDFECKKKKTFYAVRKWLLCPLLKFKSFLGQCPSEVNNIIGKEPEDLFLIGLLLYLKKIRMHWTMAGKDNATRCCCHCVTPPGLPVFFPPNGTQSRFSGHHFNVFLFSLCLCNFS